MLVPVKDREQKLRGILNLNGVGVIAYWLGMYICDLLLFLLPTCLLLLLVKAVKISSFQDDIGGIFLVLFGFGLSLIQLTYLIQFIFKNITQAIKCIFPSYILLGTVLPLGLALAVGAIASKSSNSAFYIRFSLGLLFITTPMFTFFITFVSIFINYYASTFSGGHNFGVQLFAQGMLTATPRTAFVCFLL
jgi:hypothetical protein